jgi:hypothetical protein
LVFAQKSLPLRIKLHVLAIVVEQIQVDAHRIGPLHKAEVRFPVVRADERRILRAVQVNSFYRVVGEEAGKGLFGFG